MTPTPLLRTLPLSICAARASLPIPRPAESCQVPTWRKLPQLPRRRPDLRWPSFQGPEVCYNRRFGGNAFQMISLFGGQVQAIVMRPWQFIAEKGRLRSGCGQSSSSQRCCEGRSVWACRRGQDPRRLPRPQTRRPQLWSDLSPDVRGSKPAMCRAMLQHIRHYRHHDEYRIIICTRV